MVPRVNCPYTLTPPPLTIRLFLDFRAIFFPCGPSFSRSARFVIWPSPSTLCIYFFGFESTQVPVPTTSQKVFLGRIDKTINVNKSVTPLESYIEFFLGKVTKLLTRTNLLPLSSHISAEGYRDSARLFGESCLPNKLRGHEDSLLETARQAPTIVAQSGPS